ncbi:sensor histidine kinase [Actinocrispum wychmicini]|uniref:histidine kinase n=1 Tax=Actinocrispum wychmicini TaxID=1213861 RepID=A0A4R2J6H3_9PSEU|nr:nitrate- and nitrite sensing domain-containing protein [Actinocrispum wychmicini]TCO54044.1 signal transduction histidine kinase [Actinocrispum wychmicini]
MSLARKIGLLVSLPLIAVVAYATLALFATAQAVFTVGDLRSAADIAGTAGKLTLDLQAERVASITVLATGDSSAISEQVAATDATVDEYKQKRADFQAPPEHLAGLLDRVDSDLNGLAKVRSQVASGKTVSLSAVIFQYRIIAADLLTYRENVAIAAPVEVADQIRAAALLSQLIAGVGQTEVDALRALDDDYTPAIAQEILESEAGVAESSLEFKRVASGQWQAWLDHARAGHAALAAQVLQDSISRTPVGLRLKLDPAAWRSAMDLQIADLGDVQQQADQAVLDSVTAVLDSQKRQATIETAAVLVTLAGTIAIAVWLGRPMIRGLRRLRSAAHAVAYKRLPEAVSALSTRGALGSATPKEFADRVPPAVAASGKDEIAQLASAFNEVHHSALHLAAQQAELRDQVDAIFVALARRAERLTASLIAQVDVAESTEEDPDRLAQLFKLDHLASRMRRNNNSLLVLGGEASARMDGTAMVCGDVLQAAAAQVERYTQVEIRILDEALNTELHVSPEMAGHLAHLFAELIDNATAFSAGGLPVVVEARVTRTNVVVTVSDHGIGMDPETLETVNAQLTSPTIDVRAVRSMGLTVVAQIAAWYGIRVELRSDNSRTAATRGTVATVVLPSTVIRPYRPADRRALSEERNERHFDWFSPESATPPPHRPVSPKRKNTTADHRDASRVAGVMAAYARGIGASRPSGP